MMKTPLLKDYNAEIELNNQKDEKLQHNSVSNKIIRKETTATTTTSSSFNTNTNTNNPTNYNYLNSNNIKSDNSISYLMSDNTALNTLQTPNILNRMHEASIISINNSNSELNSFSKISHMASSPQSIKSGSTILNGTNSSILCRICYGSEGKEQLLQPCNCSGTMGLMHRTCLERWLSQSNSTRCEICQYDFSSKIQKVPKSFSQWLFRPLSTKDNKNLFNDFVCFLILTPLASISTWYCVLFALRFHETENRWEAAGLVVLTTFLLFIYILWFIFSCKYHLKVFKDWQKKNQTVTLKLSEDCKMLITKEQMIRTKPANKIQFNSSSNETLIQYENEIRAQGLNINQQEQQLNKSSNDLNFATKKEDESDRVEIRKQSNNSNVINSNITEKNCTTNSNACLV